MPVVGSGSDAKVHFFCEF